jgi:hypothetical protein
MELHFFNAFSYWVNYISTKGIPQEALILILMLPIVATIIAIIRQLIGFKTLGIYLPSILTVTFLATGLVNGILIFLAILLFGTGIRFILKRLKLLYLPRMALLLTFVSLISFVILAIASRYDISRIIQVNALPLLIMILLVENFIDVQIQKGSKESIKLTITTLIIVTFCYFIMNSQHVRSFVLNYPGPITLAVILANIIIGRWTALRLVEYHRFRDILNDKNRK